MKTVRMNVMVENSTLVDFMVSAAKQFRKNYKGEVKPAAFDAVITDFVNFFAKENDDILKLTPAELREPDKDEDQFWFLEFVMVKVRIINAVKSYKGKGACNTYMTEGLTQEAAEKLIDELVAFINGML